MGACCKSDNAGASTVISVIARIEATDHRQHREDWHGGTDGVFQTTDESVKLRRLVAGTDSVSSWLDSAHDVTMSMELVRTSDSAVVWRGDSISGLGLAGLAYDDSVEIRTDTAVMAGTSVYVQSRATPGSTIEADPEAGLYFVQDTTEPSYLKRIPKGGGIMRVVAGGAIGRGEDWGV